MAGPTGAVGAAYGRRVVLVGVGLRRNGGEPGGNILTYVGVRPALAPSTREVDSPRQLCRLLVFGAHVQQQRHGYDVTTTRPARSSPSTVLSNWIRDDESGAANAAHPSTGAISSRPAVAVRVGLTRTWARPLPYITTRYGESEPD